jgi:hypothetical protein
LTPAFCIGPFARKFELMNISSSSGSSGVIFPRYRRNDEPHRFERGPNERIVINLSPSQASPYTGESLHPDERDTEDCDS